MDNTILKIVQIFVFVPHLLLMNMNSACALQGVALQDAEPVRSLGLHASAHAP